MKRQLFLIPLILIIILASCTSQKKLAYLHNIEQPQSGEYFTMDKPHYKIQKRDILYVTVKTMSVNGTITDLIQGVNATSGSYYLQGESGSYLYGYDVDNSGNLNLPVVGSVNVEGKTMDEIKAMLQENFEKVYNNILVECKLLSFKYTVIGEVKAPGTYINYNNYLTILEGIGRAGGIGEYGRRDRVLVVRPTNSGSRVFTLNLQDKNILTSEAYFLLPNDVVIVQPQNNKIFNMNLPTISFILTTVTSTVSMLILIISFTRGS